MLFNVDLGCFLPGGSRNQVVRYSRMKQLDTLKLIFQQHVWTNFSSLQFRTVVHCNLFVKVAMDPVEVGQTCLFRYTHHAWPEFFVFVARAFAPLNPRHVVPLGHHIIAESCALQYLMMIDQTKIASGFNKNWSNKG